MEQKIVKEYINELLSLTPPRCKKLSGAVAVGMLSKYLSKGIVNFKLSGANCYIDGVDKEFDLLVLKTNAMSLSRLVEIYASKDVHAVIEVKSRGVFSKSGGTEDIEKIKVNLIASGVLKRVYFTFAETNKYLANTRNLMSGVAHVACMADSKAFINTVKKSLKGGTFYSGEWDDLMIYLV